MAEYNKEQFDQVIHLISEGRALRNAVREVGIASNTFYDWINEDTKLELRYVRATEERATALVEEMMTIADDGTNDTYVDEHGNIKTDWDVLGRSKLRVDTRKWIASKLRPKKYGDSSQLKVTDGEGEALKPIIINLGSGTNPDETTE